MKTDHILVTGANGFVGQHLCRALAEDGRKVTGFVRASANVSQLLHVPGLRLVTVVDYKDTALYEKDLRDVDVVVHLAARAHVMNDTEPDPLAEFRKVNVTNTKMLAMAAAAAGVRRYVYVSSIKVNGEMTDLRSFEADDQPGFVDPYGQSKWEAEEGLREIAVSFGMEWSIVRPPLIYGPGVRGNFRLLLNILRRGLPLPLGAVRNRRSFVSVYNLVDLLKTMLDHPHAAGQRFLVKDAEDVSTSELIRHIAVGMKCPARLVPVPMNLLVMAGRLLRREEVVTRLCSSLVVNTEKTRSELGWIAPMPLATGIGRTCEWFRAAASDGVL